LAADLERKANAAVLASTPQGDATMVDVQSTDNMAIDPPPLPESDAPLMGNPVLMRGSAGRRRTTSTAKGSGWQVALPIAAVVLIAGGAAAYFFARSSQPQPLTANPPAAATRAPSGPIASTESPTAAPMAPTEAAPPPPVAARASAPPRAHVTRMARAEPVRAVVRHTAVRRARAASDEGADVSATAREAAPAPAPSAPPVISPPPAQSAARRGSPPRRCKCAARRSGRAAHSALV
jgi:hypothetical protein